MWGHVLNGIATDPLSLAAECDWVLKYHLVERLCGREQIPLDDPKALLVDLTYHDTDTTRGLFYKLQRKGLVERVVTDDQITAAATTPPQTTRARLRGAFVERAKQQRRDYTVDWVHLKLNDPVVQTLVLQDPFDAHNERAEHLIASL